MKKRFFLITLLFGLISCSNTSSSINSSSSLFPSTSDNVSTSETSSTKMDQRLVGTWYIYVTMAGVFQINEPIVVNSDGVVTLRNLTLYYDGIFQDYEGTSAFYTESRKSMLVLEIDDKDIVTWGFEDSSGTSDTGYADKTGYDPTIHFDYEGKEWPMELIQQFLNNNSTIPSYPFDVTYYLKNSNSSIYNCNVSNIVIYNVSKDNVLSYVTLLENDNFTFSTSGVFNVGINETKDYIIKLSMDQNDNNSLYELNMFIYNYSEYSKN